MTDRDPLSPRVRVEEARDHLERARSATDDEELSDRMDDLLDEIETVTRRLDERRDSPPSSPSGGRR